MHLLYQQTPIFSRTPDVIVYNWLKGRSLAESDEAITASYLKSADELVVPTWNTEVMLNELYDWTENWNGYGVPRPQEAAIESARAWVRLMYYDTCLTTHSWTEPHVTSNEEGNVTFEWWNKDKKLTVYLSQHDAWYIKVWGPDVVSEMSDGTAQSSEERQDIWSWLNQ
jgi:hypothetical protein